MESKGDKQKLKMLRKQKQKEKLLKAQVMQKSEQEPESEEESEPSMIDFNQVIPEKSSKESILKKRPRPSKEEDLDPQEEEKEESKGSDNLSLLDKVEKSKLTLDFELVSPCESYYHSVRALLNQLLDGEEQEALDLSELADNVVARASIGSVIASALENDPENMSEYKDLSEEEFNKVVLRFNNQRDVYGFTTILSFKRQMKKMKSFQHILKYVKQKAEHNCTQNQIQEMDQIFAKKNVGLLLNERLINLPLKLVPSLHSSLPDDLKFTKKQDDIEDPREFDYDYLLAISRFTIPNQRQSNPAKKGKKGKKKGLGSQLSERCYYKYEDEIFSKAADICFSFKTTFRYVDEEGNKISIVGGGGPESHFKLVYLITWSEYVKRFPEVLAFLST